MLLYLIKNKSIVDNNIITIIMLCVLSVPVTFILLTVPTIYFALCLPGFHYFCVVVVAIIIIGKFNFF